MPSSFEIKMGLAIVGYPALVAGLGVLAARFAKPTSKVRQAALAAAAAGGLITSHVGLANLPKFPPVDSIGWIPITTAIAGLLAVILAFVDGKRRLAPVMAIAVALAVYLAGKPTFARELGQFWPLGLGFAAAAGVALVGAPKLTDKTFAPAVWIGLLLTAAIAALCALWAPSALLAMLLGSMATTAGAIGIGGLILRINEPAPLAQGVFMAHLAGTVVYTHLYAKLPMLPVLLITAAVAAPTLVALIPGDSGKQRWLRSGVAVALAAALAGGAALIMHSKLANEKSDPANMYGG
jgi:hypothetical protein